MKVSLKKISTTHKIWILVPLVVIIVAMSGCSPWIVVGSHDVEYDEYNTNPTTCAQTSYVRTVTETSRDGWWSGISFNQNVKFIFTFSGFIVLATPPSTGKLSLPFVSPDCSWYYQPNDCKNVLPFTCSYRANSITVNINHTTSDNEHFEGQIYFHAATPAQMPENFVGTYVTNVWLDTSKQNWITKSVDGECVRKIVFREYNAWNSDMVTMLQQLEEQGVDIPAGVDLQQILRAK